MADEVKVAVVFADFFGQIVQDNAMLFKHFDDGLFFLGGVPAPQKFIQRGKFGLNLFAGEVTVGFGNQLAVRTIIFDTFGNNLDRNTVYDVFLLSSIIAVTITIVIRTRRIRRHRVVIVLGS